jgi:hypothetical protein
MYIIPQNWPCCAIGEASAGRMHIPTCAKAKVYQMDTARLERIISEHSQMFAMLQKNYETMRRLRFPCTEVVELIDRIKRPMETL